MAVQARKQIEKERKQFAEKRKQLAKESQEYEKRFEALIQLIVDAALNCESYIKLPESDEWHFEHLIDRGFKIRSNKSGLDYHEEDVWEYSEDSEDPEDWEYSKYSEDSEDSEGSEGWEISWPGKASDEDVLTVRVLTADNMAWVSSVDGQQFLMTLSNLIQEAAKRGDKCIYFEEYMSSGVGVVIYRASEKLGTLPMSARVFSELLEKLGYKSTLTKSKSKPIRCKLSWM